MQDKSAEPSVDLGVYGKTDAKGGIAPIDRIALIASVVWLLGAVLFLVVAGAGAGDALGPFRFLIFILAVVLPVALIWIAAIVLKSARDIRKESAQLRASMDAMRQVYVTQAQIAATTMGPNVERKIDEIVRGQRRAEDALASFAAPSMPAERPASASPLPQGGPQAEAQPQQQQALAFADQPAQRLASVVDFISALNFPETADDREGFAALRRALDDPRLSPLIRASQDVLTLLSKDGIYMDDLSPERARPEIWRRFAAGERGRAIAALGGIRDRSSLSLSSARMRQDTIFRDAAHHFLRAFDRVFAQMAEHLTDHDMIKIADTRSARAFMLLGRVAGIFD
ncbi:MAG: hypothetical protein AAGF55_06290 [Pseudomonadota bacterium]